MTSDALQLKRSKNKLWKRDRTTGCSSDLLNYKTANNKLRQLCFVQSSSRVLGLMAYWYTGSALHEIPQSYLFTYLTCNLRGIYEKDLAMNIENKRKAFCKCVNSRVKTPPTIDELYKSDGTFISEHSEMVNLFNDHFCSAFTSEDHFIPPPETDSSPYFNNYKIT